MKIKVELKMKKRKVALKMKKIKVALKLLIHPAESNQKL